MTQRPVRTSTRHAPIERSFSSPLQDLLRVRFSISVSGNCSRPAYVPTSGGKENEYRVRCRSCPSCLRARQHLWRLRSQWEVVIHDRSWLFTGTFRNQTHDRRVAETEVTRYLKRLRIKADRSFTGITPPIRYLFMFERHKSGAWHTHAVLHSNYRYPVSLIRSPWTAGFSRANITDVRGSAYVVKYATKSLLDNTSDRRPRIRASRRYGRAVMLSEQEAVQALQARTPEPLHETWTHNLIDGLQLSRKRKRDLWQFITEVQAAHGRIETTTDPEPTTILVGRKTIDPETGEVHDSQT